MTPAYLAALLYGGAATIYLLLALLFARGWRRTLTARLGALLALSGFAYIALIVIDGQLGGPPWRLPFHMLSLAAPALFWMFARSWFDEEVSLGPGPVAVTIGVVALGLAGNYLASAMGRAGPPLALGWRLSSLVLLALGVRAALGSRAADLVEVRRRVRLVLVAVLAVSIGWIVLAELLAVSWPPPPLWRVANAATMLALGLAVAIPTLGWRDPALLAPPVTRPVATPVADESPLLARADAAMRVERLYRQEGLTIAALAARLGAPEYRLRRAINTGAGARNFSSWLNGFRLDDARQALADPAQREVPILTIAMDAGFNSLPPFNRAFRLAEGCTPSEYRARALDHRSQS